MNIFDIVRPPRGLGVSGARGARQVHVLIKSPRHMNLWLEFVLSADIDGLEFYFLLIMQFGLGESLFMHA